MITPKELRAKEQPSQNRKDEKERKKRLVRAIESAVRVATESGVLTSRGGRIHIKPERIEMDSELVIEYLKNHGWMGKYDPKSIEEHAEPSVLSKMYGAESYKMKRTEHWFELEPLWIRDKIQ